MIDSAWLVILATLVAGKLCRQWQVFDPEPAALVLNRYVIYIALPPLVVSTLQGLELQLSLLWMIIVPWLLLLVSLATVLSLARWLKWPPVLVGTLLLLTPLGNTSFLGYPIVNATLGEHALPPAVIYDQFGSFIMLSSFGLYTAAHYGAGSSVSLRGVVLRILRFPPFIALLLGLLPLPWPTAAVDMMQTVGASLVPVACFAVGLQWRLRVNRQHWLPLGCGLSIKMLLLPLAAGLILHTANTPSPLGQVGILQAGMPPMITAGAIAASSGLDKELAAAMVGFGIILAMVSLPLLALIPV